MTLPPGKLPTSRAFLDRLAKKIGDPKDPKRPASDYRVAKVLGVDPGTISRIRNRKQTFGEELALKVAAELGEPEPYLIACVFYERERSVRVRVVWEAIAKAAAIGAVVIVSTAAQALGGTLPAPAEPTVPASNAVQAIHYASGRGRRGRRREPLNPHARSPRRHVRRRADSARTASVRPPLGTAEL